MSRRPVCLSICSRLPLSSRTRGPVGPSSRRPRSRQNRRGIVFVALVVHQDAVQRAVRLARTDVDRQAVRHFGEHAFLHQEGGDAVADLPLKLAECCQTCGHQPEIERIAGERCQNRQDEGGTRQRKGREAGGAHHRQLPISGEALVDELHDDECGDRQDDRDEAGNQQAGQPQEDAEGQAVVHHQLDEAQRLGQPDQRGETAGHGKKGEQELAKNVTVQPLAEDRGVHGA